MSSKHAASEPSLPNDMPVEIYPGHIPLPPGDGRCVYRFPSGPRCRKSVSQIHPYLCDSHLHHAGALSPQSVASEVGSSAPQYDPALASDLLEAAGELTSAGDVNRVLRTVYRAMVERRLTLKEAGVLCYLAQTILHTHRAMALQQKLQAEEAAANAEAKRRASGPPSLTWNLPPLPGQSRET